MKVITVANIKGGVGKTTISLNIACGYANRGYKTLAIDLDGQANLSDRTGIKHTGARTICECLDKPAMTKSCIHKTKFGFDIIPSKASLYMIANRQNYDESGKKQTYLEAVLDKLEDYDIVIIDCNPYLNELLIEAILNANSGMVIIPGNLNNSSLNGFYEILKIKGELHLRTPFLYLINRFQDRVKYRSILKKMQENWKGKSVMLETVIREDTNVQYAERIEKAIINRPNTKAGHDLNLLLEELIRKEVR